MIDRLNTALEGRYRIERELGAGGMATVFLARDIKHNRRVAIKVLKPELAAVVGAERFLAEIETTANLQHPHILPLFDSGEADGFLFYVMPFVEGESLRERLDRERQLPVNEAMEIAAKVAGALQHAHEQGVIHRDIKPANVLMSGGEPLVADFGIALALSQAGGGRITETGLSLGTPHYMSPEQASADRELTPSSDIYALGCVTYEMLAGTPPFSGPSAQSVLIQILTEEPRLITAHRKSVPPHVAQVVAKSLEKLPADRFATADAFAEALDDPGFSYTGPHTAVAAGDTAGRSWLADPRSIALSIAVLVLIVGWALRGPAASEGDVRRYVFTERPPEGARVTFANYSRTVAVEPDGSGYYFVDRAAGRRVFRRSMQQVGFQPFGDLEQALGIATSPDGSALAVETEDGRLVVVTAAGATEVPIGETLDVLAAWLEDGCIYFVRLGEGLFRVNSGSGAVEEVTPWDSGRFLPIASLEGGRLLGWGDDGDTGGAAILDEAGGRRTVVPDIQPLALLDGSLLIGRTETGSLVAVEIDAGSGTIRRGPVALPYQVSEGGRYGFSSELAVFQVGSATLENTLVMLDREGRESRVDAPPREYLFPRFSPEGRRLAMEIHDDLGGQIWVLDFGSGALNLLTNVQGDGHNTRPLWFRDGSRVLYARNSGFYSRRADGGGEERLEWAGRARFTNVSWLGEDQLIFEHNLEGEDHRDLVTVQVGTDDPPVPFLATPADETAPLVSADGRWVAYISDATGQDRLYVTAATGDGGRMPVSTGGARNFSWGADSSELFYQSDEGFMRAEVQFEPTFEVTRERVEFADAFFQFGESASFAVHPEDGRLLFIKQDESQELTVVVNFADWVRRHLEDAGNGG
jgi:hypothetical protein